MHMHVIIHRACTSDKNKFIWQVNQHVHKILHAGSEYIHCTFQFGDFQGSETPMKHAQNFKIMTILYIFIYTYNT